MSTLSRKRINFPLVNSFVILAVKYKHTYSLLIIIGILVQKIDISHYLHNLEEFIASRRKRSRSRAEVCHRG